MLKLLQIPIFHKSSTSLDEPYHTLSLGRTKKKKNMEKRIPVYLLQSEQQILKKFQEIKLLEGERIHEATIKKTGSKWSLQEGIHGFDLKRNRYQNVIPYDRYRVKLDVQRGFSDYINASKIDLNLSKEWGQECDSAQYISCQGPTARTTSHFWQMVMQNSEKQNVVVCMVTPLEEHGISKCFKYWCDTKNDFVIFKGANEGFAYDLRLQCVDSSLEVDIPGVHYTTLLLQALDLETQSVISERVVHHLYYDQWTDFSKPDDWESIYQMSKLARGLTDDVNPLITHCSAGVGRTGTFVTLDYLFNCVHSYESPVDKEKDLIEAIVQLLRAQRMMMVQSSEQFLFLYESLKLFLLSG